MIRAIEVEAVKLTLEDRMAKSYSLDLHFTWHREVAYRV